MITSWSTGTPEANMDDEILVVLRDIVARHPWWVARAAIVVALLEQLKILPPATVLEAGCGWGTNLEALEAAGYRSHWFGRVAADARSAESGRPSTC